MSDNNYIQTVDTNLDRIVQYLQDDTGMVYLPESLHQLMDKLDYIDNLIREELYWDHDIIPQVLKKYPEVGSKRTVYRLIQAAKYVHRSKSHADKQYELDYIWHLAVKTFRLALADNNLKQMNGAIANMHKLWRDRHQETNPYDELKPHVFYLIIEQKGKEPVRINLDGIGEAIPFEEMHDIRAALNAELEDAQINALMEDEKADA